MRIDQLKRAMKQVEPPAQPFLQRHTVNYEKQEITLNPLCEKGGALIYQFTTDGREEQAFRLVPDGCIDVLFNCSASKPKAVISGYSEYSKICRLEPDTTYFGVKPYSGFLGLRHLSLTPSELQGRQFLLEDVMDAGTLQEEIAAASSMTGRAELFQRHLLRGYLDESYVSTLPGYISLSLCCHGGNLTLEKLCMDTGYSDRYCRRTFANSYSLSIKEYSRMIRFQKALRMLLKKDGDVSNMEIAYTNGYFDEAHFINDFKAMAGMTPLQFRQSIFRQAI